MKRLYLAALTHIDRACGHAFNIGGGAENSLSLLELLTMLERITGVSLSYTRLPVRESDQRVFVADIAKAKQLLGWSPQVSAFEGVSAMVHWTAETLYGEARA
jgi:CDP-paratose 2-epimerase